MIDKQNPQLLLNALQFAADRHRGQMRKDEETPYINHLIEVATILAECGADDPVLLAAAALHDTIEDQRVSREELAKRFGEEVAAIVVECTDDESLEKQERKRLQIVTAPQKSPRAKLLKIADKISNIHDVVHAPPSHWNLARRQQYLDWAEQVVNGLRGGNRCLDDLFDKTLAAARDALAGN